MTQPSLASAPRKVPMLQVVTFGCDALADAEPQALGLTYWFDAATDGEPYPVSIRFTGRRFGIKGKSRPQDTFTASEAVEKVVPSSGRSAITTRIFDIAPGEWHVTASQVAQPRRAAVPHSAPPPGPRPPSASSGVTRFAPVIRVRAPGVRLGAWPALVGVGVAVALTVQTRLAAHIALPVADVLLVSLIASLVGLLGAKLYYLAEQDPSDLLKPRMLLTAGMCIQGFVLAAIATVIFGALVVGISVGRFLDVTAPGLLFGMTIGRFGCFFGGCCAGRPTASRWGLWSSDRRLGTRRIPTQLFESTLAFTLGLATFLTVLARPAYRAGTVFIGAIAAYKLGRQLLFPMRDLPRKTSYGRTLTIAVTALVVLTDILVAVLA